MTRTVREWYFGDKDKEQIKSFSKQISILFKVKGYNPEHDMFEDYFSLEWFDFIPCVKEALYKADEYTLEEIENYIDSVYDPSVRVTLQDLEKDIEESCDTIKERLKEILFEKNKSFDDFVNFIFTCSDDVKEKFVNWLVG